VPEPKALAVTPGGDHRYSDPAHLEALLDRTVEWIATHLPTADQRTAPARRAAPGR